MEDDFSQCLVLNTRMAARAVTRRANRKLRGFGVTATQFSILTAARQRPGRSITEIAESIAMERTTLSRNLDLMARKGLVRLEGAEKGNGRLCSLSEEGQVLLDRIVPIWRASQAELREQLTQPDWPSTLRALQELARL
ncbi:MarR family transcriptional regulator [Devosia sp. H5989]|nr:MarR family transcriptional regulator [Devosia sp. H5989]